MQDAVGHVVVVGAVGIVGTIFGLPIESLVLGAIAGALRLGAKPAGSRLQGLYMVSMSTILAGAFADAVGKWFGGYFGLETLPRGNEIAAIVIGVWWSDFLPPIQRLLSEWINKFGGGK